MNVLVLRRHNHVGDMLCSLPLYAAIRRRWPAAAITLLANPTRYPVPIMDLNPYLDELVYYRKNTARDILQSHMDLRGRKFDAAFVPSTVAVSRTSHVTARITGAPLRVGVRSIDGVINQSHYLLNRTVDVQWVSERVHQMDRNLQIAEAADCALTEEDMNALRLPESVEGTLQADRFLSKFDAGMPLIGAHPGAGKPQNVWPAERFGAVIRDLHRRMKCGVIITSGALDAQQVHALAFELGEAGIPFHVLDGAPVPMLAAVMRRLHLYCTNDTGTMHVAAFAGCPTVSLFGPTNAWEWAPRGSRHRAVVSDTGEMEGITVSAVIEACDEVLETWKAGGEHRA